MCVCVCVCVVCVYVCMRETAVMNFVAIAALVLFCNPSFAVVSHRMVRLT